MDLRGEQWPHLEAVEHPGGRDPFSEWQIVDHYLTLPLTMNRSHSVSVSINRELKSVYAFLSDPANIPRWSLFIQEMAREGAGWRATTPDGTLHLRFVDSNSLGVLDHWVRVSPELEFCVPFRVVENGAGSEVLLTVFQHPGMSDEQFNNDISMVETDFRRLRDLLEGRLKVES